ncbi:hypothetical protein OS493_029930 [Desmophyllum pertusum]|uniref:Uncharacterized protein n=1 Tax=Desmophyllum pertusum TaxID=174260 RepID=A0A9W9Y8T5_9CNID|nr:hypothetical protein OS493_029930 [Desmophyllum pertusum]
MSKAHSKQMWLRDLFLFLVLVTPTIGQFTLPFLYMRIKILLPSELGSQPKDLKLTTEHIRIHNGWSVEETSSKTMQTILDGRPSNYQQSTFTAANLVDLNLFWSYEIPSEDINSSFVDQSVALYLTPADFQQELLKYTSDKLFFSVDDVASRLGIPAINLTQSYDPDDWETVVHAMISESALAFSRRLQLPSVDALARLVQLETQGLLNLTLGAFEVQAFPFPLKKATLDNNTISMIFNSSGITEASYGENTLTAALKHERINCTLHEFAILYNKSTEQVKTMDRTTLNQIDHICWIPKPATTMSSIDKNKRESHFVFSSDPVAITEDMTVLAILTKVTNLKWRKVRWAVSASLSDWEYLDAVTLPQLAAISGYDVGRLRNDSVSESVKLIFALRENGSLDNKIESHRVFIGGVLREAFNLSFGEVATLNEITEVSLQNVSSATLFKSFINATVHYFKLNVNEIIAAVQVTEEQLYYLPRLEWNTTISTIVRAVVKMEATKLQMSTEHLFQLLGFKPAELPIQQLKELMRSRIHDVKQSKMKFDTDPISLYLANNSVSEANYLNSSVLTLLLSTTGFNAEDLKLVYDLNPSQLFILGGMKFSDTPRLCGLDTTATKDRVAYNITAELVGIRQSRAVCKSTRFYVEARHKNMSYLQTAFSALASSSISFVNLVEMATNLSWRHNVWAFGLKMEDWTVLYVLNQDAFKEVTGLTSDEVLSETLLQIFQRSVQLQSENNANLRVKVNQNRGPTLNILYDLFNTNEGELIQFGGITKAQYDVLLPIEVYSRVLRYLVAKFNVSLNSVEASLNLQPGTLDKLSPTGWQGMVPLVKAEIIRSAHQQLDVTLSNFAMLLQETSESLQSLTLAQIESKWDDAFSRLLKGKSALENKSVLQIITDIGITSASLQDVTVLKFIQERINLTNSELLLLYNFSSTGIEVAGPYTFKELPGYCDISKDDLFNKRPHKIIVSLLGHNGDMTCRKIALVVAAATITVNQLSAKFNFEPANNVSMLMMFEDLLRLPWRKIAWAVNASLSDWSVLGAMTLTDIANLTSETTDNIKHLKSFRQIARAVLDLPRNSYTTLLNDYRSELVCKAASLFNVNSSKVCDGCDIVDILWNSLKRLI